MKIQLDLEFLDKLCGYLGTRPFQEVAQFILTIQQAASEQSSLPPPPEE